MNKEQFLSELQEALHGQVNQTILQQNMTYYEEYIREQIGTGKTEEEVLAQLGDPKLIARTIIDTNGGEGSYGTETTERTSNSGGDAGSFRATFKSFSFNGLAWYWKLVAILVPILVISIVLSIIFALVKALFWPAVIITVIVVIYNIVTKK